MPTESAQVMTLTMMSGDLPPVRDAWDTSTGYSSAAQGSARDFFTSAPTSGSAFTSATASTFLYWALEVGAGEDTAPWGAGVLLAVPSARTPSPPGLHPASKRPTAATPAVAAPPLVNPLLVNLFLVNPLLLTVLLAQPPISPLFLW